MNLKELLERVESLCKFVAESIEDEAAHGTVKSDLLVMADEAADIHMKLGRQHPLAKEQADIAVLDLGKLGEVLR